MLIRKDKMLDIIVKFFNIFNIQGSKYVTLHTFKNSWDILTSGNQYELCY